MLREIREAYIHRAQAKDWVYGGDPESVLRSAQVLVLATATPGEVRKAGRWAVPPDDLALEVLADRRPPWLAELVDVISDDIPARWNSRFSLMRSLVRERLIDPPANPGYILSMINGLENRDRSVYDALKADPGLLEHEIWRLFEVEGGGDTSLATHDKYTPEPRAWSWALTRLAEEGLVPRDRLLDASLLALRRDFAAFRAGWFSRFHEGLQPTVDERRQRQEDYLALISSPVPPTVSFTVTALLRAGGVSEDAADRLMPALMAKSSGTVKSALQLLPRSVRGAGLAAEALVHGSRESQVNLLAFIGKVGGLDATVRGKIAEALPAIAPSLQDGARSLLGVTTILPVDEGVAFPNSGLEQLRQTAPPTDLRGPVESLSELVDLLATLLERVEDVHEIELALDGVSRLCDRSPGTLGQIEPLVKRARKLLSSGGRGAFIGNSPRADIAGMIVAWSVGESPGLAPLSGRRLGFLPAQAPMRTKSVLSFLSYRVLEVASRAARGERQPLLALPTSRGGTIDPRALEARRAEQKRSRIRPGEADSIQAALRAGEVPISAIRFAFGSEASSHTHQGKTYTHIHFHVRVEPEPKGEPSLDDVPALFTAAIAPRGWRGGEWDYCAVGPEGPAGLGEAVRWVGTVWPLNRELFYAKGAVELGQNIDWWEARWHTRHFLEPLLLHDEPIGEMARLLIALGLAAKEPGERGLATDVLITAIREGRLVPAELGATLARLYNERIVKGTRLATSLADACRISTGHAEAIVVVVEHILAQLHGPPPADLHSLLGVLADGLSTTGCEVSLLEARAYLSGIEGSGKSAAAAKALIH